MATIQDVEALGYTVAELEPIEGIPARWFVSGYGVEIELPEPELVGFVDPAAHAERVRQFEQGMEPTAEEEAALKTAIANELALRGKADAALATLENAWTNWAGLTAAQKDAALKLTVRVVIALARLVIRKVDTGGV